MQSSRQTVLALYKKILKLGRTWQAANGSAAETAKERQYITNEARQLFRDNKFMKKPTDIESAIKEAESRYDIAIHYKNPWPRPSHIPQHTMLPMASRRRKKSDKILNQSKPAYIRSYDIGDKNH